MWPTDKEFGISGFQYDGTPVGGEIKQNPTDFKVTEVDPVTNEPIPKPPKPIKYHFEEGGLFLIGRVWRENNDHSKMVRLLSRAFGVSEDNVSTAGIKDARAEIVQLFSVYDPTKEVEDPTLLDLGMEIDSFRYAKERMYPGKMGGNHFVINIRNCNIVEDHELDYFRAIIEDGILNYYGYQRFGSGRPITAQLGRAITRQDYEDAVNIYLGGKSSGKDERYRKHWREHHDPDELLLLWDSVPRIERSLLKHLSRRNRDYRGASSKLPSFLINIAKSAFISLLTNAYLTRRGTDMTPMKGERLIKNNIEIAQPSSRWPYPLNSTWKEVFEEFDVDMKKDLKNIRHTSRLLLLKVKNWNAKFIDTETLNVRFQLGNGQYATTVLRELMQSPPSSYY